MADVHDRTPLLRALATFDHWEATREAGTLLVKDVSPLTGGGAPLLRQNWGPSPMIRVVYGGREVVLGGEDLVALRRMGRAVALERLLQGKDRPGDVFARIRGYDGFLVVRTPDGVALAPDDRGRRLAAVFTAPDRVPEAGPVETNGEGGRAEIVGGEVLFPVLLELGYEGVVFNPGEEAIALDRRFLAAVVAG